MTKLNNVIKRTKTSKYLQIHNFPIQKDLGDLQAIGLLTYVMSLPEDFVVHKTYIQTVFTRRTVESAWKILAEKGYVIGFSCYLEGFKGKQYFYNVSDVKFTQEEYKTFVIDVISVITEGGKTVTGVEYMKDSNLVIPTDSFTVQNVQYKINSIKRTDTKEIPTKEISKNKHIDSLSIVNLQGTSENELNSLLSEKKEEPKEEPAPPAPTASPEEVFTDACNEFYTEFSIGRWDKKTWNKVVKHFVTQTINSNRHLNVPAYKLQGYVYKALERIAQHHDNKTVKADYDATMKEMYSTDDTGTEMMFNDKFYNWLEERE